MATITTGTKVSVSNTPQARDDVYSSAEDAGIVSLDVLSNDLGGAAKTLYGISAALTLEDGGHTTAAGLLAAASQSVVTGLGATVTIADGKINYDTANLDRLAAYQTATDVFSYVIRLSNGAFSIATVTVTVTGSNDAPVITFQTGADAGAVVEAGLDEDEAPLGQATASGQLTATDVDTGHVLTWSVVGGGDSALGALSVDQAGRWTYTLDDIAANSLALGDRETETFTVRVTDEHGAFDEQRVTIAITGSNDAPVANADLVGMTTSGPELVRVGGEFVVNTATDNNQYSPSIVALASGGFVIVWDDASGDPSRSSVKAQLFDAAGNKVGGEFLVNTTTQFDQFTSDVAALASGGFVASWADSSSGLGTGITAQIFDAAGNKVGGEIPVDVFTGEMWKPQVAGLLSGGFVVAWEGFNNRDTTAQIFDAAGNKVGGAFLVSTNAAGRNEEPAVTGLASGGFVVTWTDDGGTGHPGYDINAQIFDAAGNRLGGEFLVNTVTAGAQYDSSVTALATGGFVVSWTDSTNPNRVAAQIFDAAGNKVGGEFLIASAAFGSTVTSLPTGGFVVSWVHYSPVGPFVGDIHARIFDALGNPAGDAFVVNTLILGHQENSDGAALVSGGFVVSWVDTSGQGGDASGSGIKAQIFSFEPPGEHQTISIDVLANDSDADNGALLTVVSASAPAGQGTASVADNAVLFDPGTDFDDLAPGRVEIVTVSYAIADEHGAQSSSTVTIRITGGAGADTFAFVRPLGGDIDVIPSFAPGIDTIALDDSVFTGLGLGALNPAAFVTGSAAADANDRIVYNGATGALSFDADGSGAGAAVQFAILQGAPAITASDFTVI